MAVSLCAAFNPTLSALSQTQALSGQLFVMINVYRLNRVGCTAVVPVRSPKSIDSTGLGATKKIMAAMGKDSKRLVMALVKRIS
jgi:hypothetical protein